MAAPCLTRSPVDFNCCCATSTTSPLPDLAIILPRSATLVPRAAASDCLCSLFNSPKLVPCRFFCISLINPSLSLFSANLLAASKFNCLPNNTSASNSAAIDVSIFNKLSAIDSN